VTLMSSGESQVGASVVVLVVVAVVVAVWCLLPPSAARRLDRVWPREQADTTPREGGAEAAHAGGVERPRTRSQTRELQDCLPDLADLIALCLLAGADVPTALRAVSGSVAEVAREPLRRSAALMELGLAPAAAWAHWDGVADSLVRAFERSRRTGAALADECERLAADLRAEQFGRIQQQARSVGVRAVLPLMGCFLPAFVLLGVVPVVAALALSLLSST
jgi:Flp pilus assembly protein TadB